jgi:hypothetical protein
VPESVEVVSMATARSPSARRAMMKWTARRSISDSPARRDQMTSMAPPFLLKTITRRSSTVVCV